MYKKNDSGKSWKAVSTPFRNGILQIFFIDDQTGFVVANEGVYRTNDGGTTWHQQLSSEVLLGNGSMTGGDYKLFFKDANNGFAFMDITMNAYTLKTTDGGKTWEKVELPYGNIIFTDNEIGYIYTHKKLLKSSDAGDNWSNIDLDVDYINDIQFCSSEKVLIANGSELMKSLDAGLTWTKQTLPVYNSPYKIISFDNELYAHDEKHIYYFKDINEIDLTLSRDAYTLSWEKEEPESMYGRYVAIRDIIFPNPKLGFAIGQNGLIMRYEKE